MESVEIKINRADLFRIFHKDKDYEGAEFCKLIFTVLVLSLNNNGIVKIEKEELNKLSDTNFNNINRYPFNDHFKIIDRKGNYYTLKYLYAPINGDEYINVDMSQIGLSYIWLFSYGKKCADCGKIFKPQGNNQKYCEEHRRRIDTYNFTCIDCGKVVFKNPGQRKHKRCECCESEYKKKYFREKKREYRKGVVNNG